MNKKNDIMDNILVGHGGEFAFNAILEEF